MRLSDNARKTVVFLGYHSDDPRKGGIDCFGTGFLMLYDGFPHLVTARHVAKFAADDPFLVRLNRLDGGADNVHIDGAKWHCHPDPTVDVAAIPFDVRKNSHDCFYVPEEELMTPERLARERIGIGDFCYTVGLFRLLAGQKRSMPVVHFGTIARMPEGEKIPVRDWDDPSRTIYVEAYLVESQSLQGLSGSPILVRGTIGYDHPELKAEDGEQVELLWPLFPVAVLGLWQGAWDASPDEALAAEKGKSVRVPIGMGVVVPTEKIIETLNSGELKAMRDRVRQKTEAASAAVPDVASVVRPKTSAPPASDENPNHREAAKPKNST
jgi:hypothetical protein